MAFDIVVFTSTHCPHCASLVESFKKLKQQGEIRKFTVVNIEQHPEQAAEFNIRSVPWFKIGDLEFQGSHSYQELAYWVTHADTDEGIRQYIIRQLEAGHLKPVEKKIKLHPDWLNISIPILGDMKSPLQARIGIGAILEGLEGDPVLEKIIPLLGNLTNSDDARVRGDAVHFLGVIRHPDAKAFILNCLNDTNADVREIANEALAANTE